MIFENALVDIVQPRWSETVGRMIYLITGRGVAISSGEYPEEWDDRGRVERNAIPYWIVRKECGREVQIKERFLRLRKIKHHADDCK